MRPAGLWKARVTEIILTHEPVVSVNLPDCSRDQAWLSDLIRALQQVAVMQVLYANTVGLECCKINVTHYDGLNIIYCDGRILVDEWLQFLLTLV